MSKVKSALFLTLVSIVLAGLCFMCAVSFNYGGYEGFRSILRKTQKDALLGNSFSLVGKADEAGDYTYGSETYVGGGYTVVYYPDGVLSKDAYEDELEMRESLLEELKKPDSKATPEEIEDADEAVKEYTNGYKQSGSLYFKIGGYDEEDEKDRGIASVVDGKPVVDKQFAEEFDRAVAAIRNSVRELGYENSRVDVRDGYSVEIFLPNFGNTASQAGVFTALGRVGGFDLKYGANEEDAEGITFDEDKNETIRDYVKSVYYVSNGGTPSIAVRFTKAGRDVVKNWTAEASGSSYVYFYVGDEPMIALTASQQIDQGTLYISGSYTAATAKATAYALNNALNGGEVSFSFSVGEVFERGALFGDLALTLCFVACGVLALAFIVFFFVRYHGLGAAHLYSFLIYLLPMILLVWGIPFLHIGIETFLAVLFGMLLHSVSTMIVYENVKKEYAQGKTMSTSVKNGYKKTFWGIFDAHIILALISFVTYFIAIGELATFAFTLGLATVISGLCTLAVGRFHWACLMSFAKNKGKFCNFKREELEDE